MKNPCWLHSLYQEHQNEGILLKKSFHIHSHEQKMEEECICANTLILLTRQHYRPGWISKVKQVNQWRLYLWRLKFGRQGRVSEVAQSCLTLCDPMDCKPPGSSIHGIFQARVLEWVAISSSRGLFWPRDWIQVSLTAGRRFTVWATREGPM